MNISSRCQVLCFILLASVLGIHANVTTDDKIVFTGKSAGMFESPVGDSLMNISGIGTSRFNWGEETVSRQGINQLIFQGVSFSAKSSQPFLIGKIEYYNGDTRPGTNANQVTLTITLILEDGAKSKLPIRLRLISTPNKGTHIDDADIVELGDAEGLNIIRVNQKDYRIRLSFGETTKDGFSRMNQFHVVEASGATAQLQAELIPYTYPVVKVADSAPASNAHSTLADSRSQFPPAIVSTQKVESLQLESSATTLEQASSTAEKVSSSITKISLPNASATAETKTQPASSQPNQFTSTSRLTATENLRPANAIRTNPRDSDNNPSFDKAPTRLGVKPTKSIAPVLALPTTNNPDAIIADINEIPSTSDNLPAPAIVAELPTVKEIPLQPEVIEQPTVTLPPTPIEPTVVEMPKPPQPKPVAARSKSGQTAYLAPSSFVVQRALNFSFYGETGLSYRIQSSADDTNWKDCGDLIEGKNEQVNLYQPLDDIKILRYRIQVIQSGIK